VVFASLAEMLVAFIIKPFSGALLSLETGGSLIANILAI
jgi:hypothetical protein